MEETYTKVYSFVIERMNLYPKNIRKISDLGKRDEIFLFSGKRNADFVICFSKILNDPRIEIQLSLPHDKDYIIIGEFYDFKNNHKGLDDILKIIQAILSNKIKISQYFYKDKLTKTKYEYSYYIDNEVKLIKEVFKNKFIFPWKKDFIVREFFFESWIK